MTQEGRRLLAATTAKYGPWVAEERGGYAKVRRGDGSLIIVGDALYHPQNVADAALIVAAVNSFEALLDLAEEVSRTQPAAVEMFRRNGIVFDKWPPEIIPPERWNAETLAALDPEVRWQGIAFSLYTDLCQLASHADAALPPSRDSTPDPLE